MAKIKTLDQIINETRRDPLLCENPFLAYFVARKLAEQDRSFKPRMASIVSAVEMKTKISAPYRGNKSYLHYRAFFSLHQLLRDDILEENYRYFLPEGLYLLAKKISKDGGNLDLQVSYRFIKKRKDLAHLVCIPEEEIARHWNPHFFNLTLPDIDLILNFMRRKFAANKDLFFQRYGSQDGSLAVIEDIKEKKDFKTYLMKIYSLIQNGEMLERLLSVQDTRFHTEWNSSVILLSPQEIDIVRRFLLRTYQQDSELFYQKYGSPAGIMILSRELRREGVAISPSRIQSFFSKNKAQTILGITDSSFRKRWNAKSVVGLTDPEHLDRTLDYLIRRYRENPATFFARYGCDIGIYNLGKDITSQERSHE